MASSANAKRVASVLRGRGKFFQTFAEVYQPTITREKEKIMDILKEKTGQLSNTTIGQQLKVAKEYYKLEMAPPNANEIQKLNADLALAKDFVKTGCYKFLTVKQAWLLFLVGLEISMWFYLGETIGKFHIVGYKV